MEGAFTIAALWLALAILSTVIAYHLRISIALVEICMGIVAAAVADYFFGKNSLGNHLEWVRFLAAMGAVLLTFLAGAELDLRVIRRKWKEVFIVGVFGFLAPFSGVAVLARFILHWESQASWLAGIALSTTSMAVVYAVMLETGFNKTEFGKGILGACFINDLGTVLALGLLFAPFTYRTILFVVVTAIVLTIFPILTKRLTKIYGNKTAAVRAKWVILVLCGLGALALWSGSEAVLPAYIAGMLLANFARKEEHWIRRFRTLTVGFLTPFYFLRAGSLVSIPALITAPVIFLVLLAGKVASKIFGLYPIMSRFREEYSERWFYTLMMSTGLTFGTISALYGFSHGIITREQYSLLAATVIASAVLPTMIANMLFLPKHLMPAAVVRKEIGKISEGGIDEE
ncbi:MAG: cation:proton antiporter [Candidatus Omnitrophica bacterium]|nr:cation:proton antiporter [Candidatus Omnitrophota bacterium]